MCVDEKFKKVFSVVSDRINKDVKKIEADLIRRNMVQSGPGLISYTAAWCDSLREHYLEGLKDISICKPSKREWARIRQLICDFVHEQCLLLRESTQQIWKNNASLVEDKIEALEKEITIKADMFIDGEMKSISYRRLALWWGFFKIVLGAVLGVIGTYLYNKCLR